MRYFGDNITTDGVIGMIASIRDYVFTELMRRKLDPDNHYGYDRRRGDETIFIFNASVQDRS